MVVEKKDDKGPAQTELFETNDNEEVIEFDQLHDTDEDSGGEDLDKKESSRAEKRIRDLVAKNKEQQKKLEEIEAKLAKAESSSKKTVSNLQVENAKKEAESAKAAVDAAKRAWKDAYNSGDDEAIAEANINIASAVQYQNSTQEWLRYQESLATSGDDTEEKKDDPKDTPKQPEKAELKEHEQKWVKANRWFGVDPVMTMTVKGIHMNLMNSGYNPDDTEDAEYGQAAYWKEIDTQMSKLFPEQYKKTSTGKNSTTPVNSPSGGISAGGVKGKKTIRLTEEHRQMAARLGIKPERYAEELAKKMAGNK